MAAPPLQGLAAQPPTRVAVIPITFNGSLHDVSTHYLLYSARAQQHATHCGAAVLLNWDGTEAVRFDLQPLPARFNSMALTSRHDIVVSYSESGVTYVVTYYSDRTTNTVHESPGNLIPSTFLDGVDNMLAQSKEPRHKEDKTRDMVVITLAGRPVTTLPHFLPAGAHLLAESDRRYVYRADKTTISRARVGPTIVWEDVWTKPISALTPVRFDSFANVAVLQQPHLAAVAAGAVADAMSVSVLAANGTPHPTFMGSVTLGPGRCANIRIDPFNRLLAVFSDRVEVYQ